MSSKELAQLSKINLYRLQRIRKNRQTADERMASYAISIAYDVATGKEACSHELQMFATWAVRWGVLNDAIEQANKEVQS